MTRRIAASTSVALTALAGLHLAWGAGASFPARDRKELADLIVGTHSVPPPRQCYAVVGLLGAASTLVIDVGPWPRSVRRAGVATVAAVLGLRGMTGLLGRTSALVPWEPSSDFVVRDRRFYGPLCPALAAGAVSSLRA